MRSIGKVLPIPVGKQLKMCELFRHEQRDSAKRTSTGKGRCEEVFSGVPIVRQLHQSHERVTGDPEPEGYTNYINRCEILKKILS